LGLIIIGIFLFFFLDISANIRDPIFADYLNQSIDSHHRATMLSTLSFAEGMMIAILYPLIGWIASFHLSYGLLTIGTMIVCGAFFFRLQQQ
jgi:hypothetical protein